MAAIDFPSSPSVNQVFTSGTTSWQWDGASWVAYAPTSGNLIFDGGTLDAGVVSAGTNNVKPTSMVPNSLPSPYMAVGSTLISNGNAWVTQGTIGDTQTFDSSGTWTKPSTGSQVRIQMWGGGGGGSRAATTATSAGGGGGYFELTVPIASMGATATVTVGAAGVGRTATTGVGTSGGNSGVTLGSGSTVYVSGGQGGQSAQGGFGGWGGLVFTTTAGTDANIAPGQLNPPSRPFGAGGDACNIPVDGFTYTGGGGGGVNATNGNGSKGIWGGGGGTRGTGAGGTSIFAGAGGNSASAGAAPGGGGGCATTANTNATDGAVGRVIITTF